MDLVTLIVLAVFAVTVLLIAQAGYHFGRARGRAESTAEWLAKEAKKHAIERNLRVEIKGDASQMREQLVAAISGTTLVNRSLPEAFSNEDEEVWWIQGHVPAAFAFLAVLHTVANQTGPGHVFTLLTGVEPDQDTAFWYPKQLLPRAHVDDTLARVEHGWWIEDPANDEALLPSTADTVGATAWTVVHTEPPA